MRGQKQHKLTNSDEWNTWQNMRCRVKDKSKIYLKRGIKVYEPWQNDFMAFYTYLMGSIGAKPGKDYQLDRINNDCDYEPGNLRWATIKQQARNRTTSKYLTLNNKTQTIADWADETGLTRNCIYLRIRKNWPVESVLNPKDLSNTGGVAGNSARARYISNLRWEKQRQGEHDA